MADQYTTISHLDIAAGIDASNSEDKIPDGYSEDIVNLDTTDTGQLHLRPGYERAFGNHPVKVLQSRVVIGPFGTVNLELDLATKVVPKSSLVKVGLYGSLPPYSTGSTAIDSILPYSDKRIHLLWAKVEASKLTATIPWYGDGGSGPVTGSEGDVITQSVVLLPDLVVYGLQPVSESPFSLTSSLSDIARSSVGGSIITSIGATVLEGRNRISTLSQGSIFTSYFYDEGNIAKYGLDTAGQVIGLCDVMWPTDAGDNMRPGRAFSSNLSKYLSGDNTLLVPTTQPNGYVPVLSAVANSIADTVVLTIDLGTAAHSIGTLRTCLLGPQSSPAEFNPPVLFSSQSGAYDGELALKSVDSVSDNTLIVTTTNPTGADGELGPGLCLFNYGWAAVVNHPWLSKVPVGDFVSAGFVGAGIDNAELPLIGSNNAQAESARQRFTYNTREFSGELEYVTDSPTSFVSGDPFIDWVDSDEQRSASSVGFTAGFVGRVSSVPSPTSVKSSYTITPPLDFSISGYPAPSRLPSIEKPGKLVRFFSHDPVNVPLYWSGVTSYAISGLVTQSISEPGDTTLLLYKTSGAPVSSSGINRTLMYSWGTGAGPWGPLDQTSQASSHPDFSYNGLAGDMLVLGRTNVLGVSEINYDESLAFDRLRVAGIPESGIGVLLSAPPSAIEKRLAPRLVGVHSRLIPAFSGLKSSERGVEEWGGASFINGTMSDSYLGVTDGSQWAWAPASSWNYATGSGELFGILSDSTNPGDTWLRYEDSEFVDQYENAVMLLPSNESEAYPTRGDLQYRYNLGGISRDYCLYFRSSRSSFSVGGVVSAGTNIYSSWGSDSAVSRFDGTNAAQAGSTDWQPLLSIYPAYDLSGLVPSSTSVTVVSVPSRREVRIGIGNGSLLSIGSKIQLLGTQSIFRTVTSIAEVEDADAIFLEPDLPVGFTPTSISTTSTYRYYFRTVVTDHKNNRWPGPAVQSEDAIVSLQAGAAVRMSLLAPPRTAALLSAKAVDIEVYRTASNTTGPFYRVGTLPVSFDYPCQKLNFVDRVPDSSLSASKLDPFAVEVYGANLGTGTAAMPAGNLITSTGRRLVTADLLEEERAEIVVSQDPTKPGVVVDSSDQGAASIVPQYGINDKMFSVGSGSSKDTLELKAPTSVTTVASDAVACSTHWRMDHNPGFGVADWVWFDPGYVLTNGNHPLTPGASVFRTELSGPVRSLPSSTGGVLLGGTGGRVYRATRVSASQIAVSGTHPFVLGSCLMFFKGPSGADPSLVYGVSAISGGGDLTIAQVLPGSGLISMGAADPLSPILISEATARYSPVTYSGSDVINTTYTPVNWPFTYGETVYFKRLVGAGLASGKATALSPGSFLLDTGDGASIVNGNVYLFYTALAGTAPVVYNAVGTTNAMPIPLVSLKEDSSLTYDYALSDQNLIDTYVSRCGKAINYAASINYKDSVGVGTLNKPAVYARWGRDFNSGTLIIKPCHPGDSVLLNIEPTGATSSRIRYFVNGTAASGEVVSSRKRLPHRVVISLDGYQELADRPYSSDPELGLSAVDVGVSDGEEITAIVPFFSKSAFTAAQQEALLVVLKENSIYVIDVEARYNPNLGRAYLQKLQTRGIGCSYKGAAAETDDGVVFCHTSGVYKLNRDLSVIHIGDAIDRMWLERLNPKSVVGVSLWPEKRKVIASYSVGEDGTGQAFYTANNQFVYDFSREAKGSTGSWSRYVGPPVLQSCRFGTGIAFLGADNSLYLMNSGTNQSDYRDDGQPIAFSWTYKACDFGDSGRRKVGGGVVTSFRATNTLSGITISQASDMSRTFELIPDTLTIDSSRYKVVSLKSSLNDRKFQYLQLKYDGSITAPVEFTSLDFIVSGLTHRGLKQAATASAE